MKKRTRTQKYRFAYHALATCSFLLTFMPIIYFLCLGFIQGEEKDKIVLGCTIIVSLFLTFLNVLFKYSYRCTIWILLAGIHHALNNVQTLVVILAITSCLDEFVIMPAKKHCQNIYTINKEVDKRGIS